MVSFMVLYFSGKREQQDFLYYIFRFVLIAYETACRGEHGLCKQIVEGRLCTSVPVPASLYDFIVTHFLSL